MRVAAELVHTTAESKKKIMGKPTMAMSERCVCSARSTQTPAFRLTCTCEHGTCEALFARIRYLCSVHVLVLYKPRNSNNIAHTCAIQHICLQLNASYLFAWRPARVCENIHASNTRARVRQHIRAHACVRLRRAKWAPQKPITHNFKFNKWLHWTGCTGEHDTHARSPARPLANSLIRSRGSRRACIFMSEYK